MFTKEDFIMIMAAIEKQHEYDLGYTSILSQVLKTDDVPAYDHSSISNLLFALLQKQFVPVGGQCEIERYCWELNFGWADGNKVISYDDLWETLIKRQSLNTDAYAKGLEVDSSEFVSSSETASRFFTISDQEIITSHNNLAKPFENIVKMPDLENYHEEDVHDVATSKAPKHKTFDSVSVGDYHGNHAHYFFKEEHCLEHFNVVKSCDGKIEAEGRVISVIGPNELVIEHNKQVVFDGKVIVLTDFSLNKDGFKKKEEK